MNLLNELLQCLLKDGDNCECDYESDVETLPSDDEVEYNTITDNNDEENEEDNSEEVVERDVDNNNIEDEHIYAPYKKPIKGVRTLTCVVIKWTKNTVKGRKKVNGTTARKVGSNITQYYERNSRGMLDIQSKGVQVSVPYVGKRDNVRKAENYVISKYPGSRWYAIINSVRNISSAGGGIAHLRGALYQTANHEIGHLLGLGHAAAYRRDGSLDQYGDPCSVMSKYTSPYLTAPQYYHLGWLPRKEVVILEPGKVYEIKKLSNFDEDGISAIMIPPELLGKSDKHRTAFISYPWRKRGGKNLALHLARGGSSQLVKIFGKEYHDKRFTHLRIKRLGMVGTKIRLVVTIEKEE